MFNFLRKQPTTQSAAPAKRSSWIPMDLMSRVGTTKTKAGIHINETQALFNSAVFACERGISESLAVTPRDIFEKNNKNERVKVTDHPTLRVVTIEANPLMSSFNFFQTLQHHALHNGNGYAEIQFERGTGRVLGLWPIPPERVTPEVIEYKNGKLDLQYKIRLPDKKEMTLSKDRVLHIAGLGYDGIRGYPVLRLMAEALGLAQALQDFGSLFFGQGAQIPGYVTVPDDFSEEQLLNMKKYNDSTNNGLANAHRWKFLYESLKFTPASAKPDESQMLESRVFQIQEVARFYRYPLHKLQEHSSGGGYNSLEQHDTEYYIDTMMPWFTRWEQELNRKLFIDPRDRNKYIKFNINAMMRGDSAARSSFYRTMVMTGIMSRNEARALEDLQPVEGGDEILTPLNMTTEREMDSRERVQD